MWKPLFIKMLTLSFEVAETLKEFCVMNAKKGSLKKKSSFRKQDRATLRDCVTGVLQCPCCLDVSRASSARGKEHKLTWFRSIPFFPWRPISKKSFLQHVEELCTNNNLKFQEEFSVCCQQLSQHCKTSGSFLGHISCPF